MGNAFTAVADDPFAAYYNIGGLSQIERPAVAIGLQLGRTSLGDPALCPEPDGVGCSEPFYYTESGQLTTQQKRYGYDQPHGLTIGLAVPLFKRVNFGLTAYLPVDVRWSSEGEFEGVGLRLARFQTTDPYLPDYILYQNRAQRFAIYTGLSYEIFSGLGIGVGATVLAGSGIDVAMNAAVQVSEGPPDENGDPTTVVTTSINPQMSMGLSSAVSPIAGVFWDLETVSQTLEHWQVGLTYRGESKMTAHTNIATDVSISTEVEGSDPLSYGMAVSGIEADVVGFFTPQQAALGVSGMLGSRLRLAADLTWANWAAFRPSMMTVPDSVDEILGVTVVVESAREVDTSGFRDILVPRLGIEGRLGPFMEDSSLRGLDMYIRAGCGFEPNPFPLQTELTNLLNSDRIIGAAGLGATMHNPLSRERALPMSIDLSLQYQYLVPTLHTKTSEPQDPPTDGYPVEGSYTSRGSVLQGAVTFQFGF